MSKATARRLVIDCSVMRATGGEESKHPVGSACRTFLNGIYDHGHRLIISDAIIAEWNKYRNMGKFSKYANLWQTQMMRNKRVDRLPVPADRKLRDSVAETAADPHVAVLMEEDMHLIEAALASDRLVASLDHVRDHFARAAAKVAEIGGVAWINPAVESEQCEDWLKRGAKCEPARQLKKHPSAPSRPTRDGASGKKRPT